MPCVGLWWGWLAKPSPAPSPSSSDDEGDILARRSRWRCQVKLTTARLAWLSRLATGGPAHRARGRVGYDCMQLGLTEWNWVEASSGEPVSVDDARKLHKDRFWDHIKTDGERITGFGLEVLRRAVRASLTTATQNLIEHQSHVHEENSPLPPPTAPPGERSPTVRGGRCGKAQTQDGTHRQCLGEANEGEGSALRFAIPEYASVLR